MFAVSVIFAIKDRHIKAFRESILAHAARTLAREDGCRRFDVGFDAENPVSVFLYELFDNRAAFNLHAESEYLADFFDTAGDWIASKEASRWDISIQSAASCDPRGSK